ncbi:MAG TPA: TrkH family potassium uptake protein [Acidimicrobiia bacterium]|nr:TrkH family potassium uptake protein [Acidimicrobiia bacterium]
MSLRRLVFIVAAVVEGTAAVMLTASVVAVVYREWDEALAITLGALVVLALADLVRRGAARTGELTMREGFAAVGLSWCAMVAVGTIPYLVTGTVGGFTEIFFETASGFTTTGATVIATPEMLPRSILWWRALTQWIGGMGIIVLSIAILPLLGVGGVQLARAEWPGGQPDRLTPRFRETAKRLWLVYLAFTVAAAISYVVAGMGPFDALTHSLTTLSTGGFSTRTDSLAAFSTSAQWVAITFMFLGGTSFVLHLRALKHPGDYLRSAEFRLFGMIVLAAAAFLAVGTWGDAVVDHIRSSLFTVLAIITTTGYTVSDWGRWGDGVQVMIVGLMFVGGMAGSTSGSIKVYRLGILYQGSRADMRRLIHPRGVFVTRLGHQQVPEKIAESVQSFFILYMFLFMTGIVAFAVIEAFAGIPIDLATSVSSVASALGNIGPGLSEVGPISTFAGVPTAGKWLLSFLMIVGRLEIFPIVLLFTREMWRR